MTMIAILGFSIFALGISRMWRTKRTSTAYWVEAFVAGAGLFVAVATLMQHFGFLH